MASHGSGNVPSGFFVRPPPSAPSQATLPAPPPPGAAFFSPPPPLYNFAGRAGGRGGRAASHQQHHRGGYHSFGATSHQSSFDQHAYNDNQAAFRCEKCRLDLPSQQALDGHVSTHIQCKSCEFTASPKLVKAHYASAHGKFGGSGFKHITVAVPGCRVQRFRICVGNRPEDVAAWIAERKRKFPRREQVPVAEPLSKKRKGADKQLSGLLDGYGSSSSSESDKDNDKGPAGDQPLAPAKGNNSHAHKPPNYQTRVCRHFIRHGSCRNGDACNFLHEQQQPHQARIPPRKQPRTLLEKLLQQDVRREAVLTIQVINFLVETDFLQQPNASL